MYDLELLNIGLILCPTNCRKMKSFKLIFTSILLSSLTFIINHKTLYEEFKSGNDLPMKAQYSGKKSSDFKIQKLDSFLHRKANQGQWFTALYAKENNIIYAKGFGYAKKNERLNSISTLYDVGSITKIFTALAIVQLQELDKLSFSDNLQKYFPNISADKKGITIHQLLTHSSGLRTYHDKKGDFEKMDRQKAITRINKQRLSFTPGSSFQYSNSGYTLLAYLIEDITEMSFREYCSENIFKPLEMHETCFHGDPISTSNLAFGYGDNVYMDNNINDWPKPGGALIGNGGLISSAEDLLKLIDGLLKNKVLLSSSLETILTQHLINTRYKDIYFDNVKQGYGWNIHQHPTLGKIIFAGGSNNYGFVSRLKYYEEYDSVLIILTNNFKQKTRRPIISETELQEIEKILF